MYDVIIIGGGPGGSASGSALAKAGKKVLILERERFPRFHVGESLIPYGNEILREIGVWEKMESAGFMPKLGAEFVLGNAKAKNQVLFARYLAPQFARTFQVERSKFDNILLEHAASLGCEVWQECKVLAAREEPGKITVVCAKDGVKQELSARWVIDASGRDAFLGKQFGLKKTDLGMPKKFATFAHFRNVRRNDPPEEGNITVVRVDFGWLWIIPLDEEKTSVGLVQMLDHFKKTGMSPGDFFDHVVARTPELERRMGGAERIGDFHFTGDYTYRYLRNAGDRWLLVGDAAGFIDPIFSSGVMLSLKSGYLASRKILGADRKGAALPLSEQQDYTRQVGRMCGIFLNMIRMFYDNSSFEVFMTQPPEKMRRALNHLVAGNTDLGWRLKLQVWLFYRVCWLQRYISIVPRLELKDRPKVA